MLASFYETASKMIRFDWPTRLLIIAFDQGAMLTFEELNVEISITHF